MQSLSIGKSKEKVQQMLDRFNEVSNGDNTTIKRYGMSIMMRCDCGCEKVEHYNVPTSNLQERFYVELCPKHELKH